ncbi:hypothetical protein GCM10011317_27950 [Niveispirillum cyanobacteriorum]|nr:hypothetical protein GCM10011317_27950 [Niveispirillum cyanobacteriorum]
MAAGALARSVKGGAYQGRDGIGYLLGLGLLGRHGAILLHEAMPLGHRRALADPNMGIRGVACLVTWCVVRIASRVGGGTIPGYDVAPQHEGPTWY